MPINLFDASIYVPENYGALPGENWQPNYDNMLTVIQEQFNLKVHESLSESLIASLSADFNMGGELDGGNPQGNGYDYLIAFLKKLYVKTDIEIDGWFKTQAGIQFPDGSSISSALGLGIDTFDAMTDTVPKAGNDQKFLYVNGTNIDYTDTPELSANKGQADGYCPLNAQTKIPVQYLPDYLQHQFFIVADNTEKDALTGMAQGDECLVLDDGDGKKAVYVYDSGWTKLSDPDFENVTPTWSSILDKPAVFPPDFEVGNDTDLDEFTNVNALNFDETHFDIVDASGGGRTRTKVSLKTVGGPSFATITPPDGDPVVADQVEDTMTIETSDGLTITGDAAQKKLTFAVAFSDTDPYTNKSTQQLVQGDIVLLGTTVANSVITTDGGADNDIIGIVADATIDVDATGKIYKIMGQRVTVNFKAGVLAAGSLGMYVTTSDVHGKATTSATHLIDRSIGRVVSLDIPNDKAEVVLIKT
jgi:hypothetical protein